MKLFLSGGGSGTESFELDKKFIDAIDIKKPVLYIPIAMDPLKNPYEDCFKWLLDNFAPMGFQNFIMWTEKDLQTKSIENFDKFGGIYIGGGNTFKLLNELRKLGILEVVKKLAEKDVPIYGGSAGALIFSNTIITATPYDDNNVGLVDINGLNMIHNSYLWVHYEDFMDSLIQTYIIRYNISKVICLSESTGLFVSDQSIEAIGPSKTFVFVNAEKRQFLPGVIIET